MKKIAFLNCTRSKQKTSCRAKEMYLPSALFSKTLMYIKTLKFDNYYILSAKYGLLDKNDIIVPYDVSIKKLSKTEKLEWKNKTLKQIFSINPKEIHFYTSNEYENLLIPTLQKQSIICYTYLKGLGIGSKMSWYDKHTVIQNKNQLF